MYHGGSFIKNHWSRGVASFALCLMALSMTLGCSLGTPELSERTLIEQPSIEGVSINGPLIDGVSIGGASINGPSNSDSIANDSLDTPKSALFQNVEPVSSAQEQESFVLHLDPPESTVGQDKLAAAPVEKIENAPPEEPASGGAVASDGASGEVKLVSGQNSDEINPDDLEVLAVVQESSADSVPRPSNKSHSTSESDSLTDRPARSDRPAPSLIDSSAQAMAPGAKGSELGVPAAGVSIAEVSDRSRVEVIPASEILPTNRTVSESPSTEGEARKETPREEDATVITVSDAVKEPPASAAVAVSDAGAPRTVEIAPLAVKEFAAGIVLGDEPSRVAVSNAEQPIDEEAAAVLSIATDAAASLFSSAGPTPEVTEPSPSDAPIISPALEEATPAMSDAQLEIKPISQLNVDIKAPEGKFPENVGAKVFAKRREYHYTSNGPADADFGYYWQSPTFCHRALYFEQPNLERYGRSAGILQPAVSGAHFFATVPTLPYQMVYYGTRTCCYHRDYGYDCAPRERVLPRWGTAAGIAEAGAMTGLILLIP